MSKVKLIITEGYGGESRPYLIGSEKVLDLGLEVPDSSDIRGIVRYDWETDENGERRVDDQIDPIVRYERINDLVGKLLTVSDAMFADSAQRKAAKDLFMKTIWDWYTAQHESLTDPWRADRFPKTKEIHDKELKEVFGE